MEIKCCSPAELATESLEQKETTEVLFQLTVSVIMGTGKNLQTCTRIKQPLVGEILKKSKDNTGSLQPNTESLQPGHKTTPAANQTQETSPPSESVHMIRTLV